MKLDLDSHELSIPCPECGNKIVETIGRLKSDPIIPCDACGANISIDANELRKGIDSAQESLDKLTRSIRNFGK